MSHHHQRHHSEPSQTNTAEPISKPMIPLFDKNDLSFLALIKPLLSPKGQKLVDLVLIFNGVSLHDTQPDLSGLLSQLNSTGENNPVKELLLNLVNSTTNQENNTSPNLAVITSLLNSLNQKNKPEDS